MDYYIAPVNQETEFLKISKPEEIKVFDPACGSGHMLTYAFDLLDAIYEEEGYAPSEIPGLILTTICTASRSTRAGALAAFALMMKAGASASSSSKARSSRTSACSTRFHSVPSDLDFLVAKDGDKHAEE